MSRFAVGAVVPFIRVKFTRGGEPRFSSLYYPWCDTLDEIQVLELRCVEEHNVPGDWDDELKYKGYLFKSLDGKDAWRNQYPRASYGQLDDSNDGNVRRHTPGVVDEDTYMNPFVQAARFMDNVLRGIRQLKEDSPQESLALAIHYSQLREAVEAKGYTVKVQPCVIHFTDGRPTRVLHEMLETVLTKEHVPQ